MKIKRFNTSKCYQSFKRDGTVCGGCQWSSNCQAGRDSVRRLSQLLDKIDPGKQIKVVEIR